jgi:hypothetical protein
MEEIGELIAGAVANCLLRYPGAFIRWLFTGFRRPWKHILAGEETWDALIGGISLAAIIWLLHLL